MSASFAAHGLERGDRLAEGVAALRVLERLLERALREADRQRGDADPADVEHLEELLQPLARARRAGSPRARGSPANESGRVSEAFQPIFRYGSPTS